MREMNPQTLASAACILLIAQLTALLLFVPALILLPRLPLDLALQYAAAEAVVITGLLVSILIIVAGVILMFMETAPRPLASLQLAVCLALVSLPLWFLL